MPRFVVLDHDWPHPHRDLFLERGGELMAWQLPPEFDLSLPIPATAAPVHRLVYLDFEGPLVGGGRGSARRWDWGEMEWGLYTDNEIGLRLYGTHFRGRFRMSRIEGKEWVLQGEPEPRVWIWKGFVIDDPPATGAGSQPVT